jgi:drug/metabolite transporter (DMT)-like permease
MGVTLAVIGALLLTPDTLLMRLSQLDGWNMLIWRGGLSGLVYFVIWTVIDRHKAWPKIATFNFGILIVCQIFNAVLFSIAIALAPVVIVLIGVATVPVLAALLSRLILKEPLSKRTLVTSLVVLSGLLISLLGHDVEGFALDTSTLVGLLLGLGVAFALAMNFTLIRKDSEAPFVLAMGIGAICAAWVGFLCADTLQWFSVSNMISIAFTGICILPLSFVALSYAARNLKSSTVSLIMLSETVLGPLWVWWGIGEKPNMMMLIGGAIVLSALVVFIVFERRINDLKSA